MNILSVTQIVSVEILMDIFVHSVIRTITIFGKGGVRYAGYGKGKSADFYP